MDQHKLRKVEEVLREHLAVVRRLCETSGSVDIQKLTITYGDLVKKTEVGTARGQKPYLDAIAAECLSRHEPLLDCLVVNKKTRMPGIGRAGTRASWEQEVRDCIQIAR
jgi:hypothetical protein